MESRRDFPLIGEIRPGLNKARTALLRQFSRIVKAVLRAVIAPVHPPTLKWAREAAGYPTVGDAIERFTTKKLLHCALHLAEWESGEAAPTVSDARNLADFYHRPMTFFYLRTENISEEKDPKVDDFRRGKLRGDFSPNLRLLLRQVGERQQWVREFLRESPESGNFSGLSSYAVRPAPEALGAEIRQWLRVDEKNLERAKSNNKALGHWIGATEAHGIAVLQGVPNHWKYQVAGKEFSGCVLADAVAPFVVLNNSDTPAKRIFTLLHELAHLWIARPGVSRLSFRADAFRDGDDEAYCNRVASAALLPLEQFRQNWENWAENDAEAIRRLALQFKASRGAVAVRAARAQLITQKRCNELLKEYSDLHKNRPRQGKGGGESSDKKALKRVGDYFARLTLDAYEQGAISAMEVSDLFGVKLDHLGKIAEQLRFPLHRWARK